MINKLTVDELVVLKLHTDLSPIQESSLDSLINDETFFINFIEIVDNVGLDDPTINCNYSTPQYFDCIENKKIFGVSLFVHSEPISLEHSFTVYLEYQGGFLFTSLFFHIVNISKHDAIMDVAKALQSSQLIARFNEFNDVSFVFDNTELLTFRKSV